MLLEWLRVVVGTFLMLNYSVPLLAIFKNPGLRENPTPLLAFNMSLAGFVIGLMVLCMGTFDIVSPEDTLLPVCVSLQHIMLGAAFTFKTACFFLAVDQFVAVNYSLRYLTIMDEWMQEMILFIWSWMLTIPLFGFVSYQLGIETIQEYLIQPMLGKPVPIENCHSMKTAFILIAISETIQFLMCIVTAALFFYTAMKGFQQERRDKMLDTVNQTGNFFLRYKSFKRIVKVISVVLTLDILGTAIRIASRWDPQSTLNKIIFILRLLFSIVEGWTYGLAHQGVRRAIRKLLGIPSNRVGAQENVAVIRPRANDEWPEREIQNILQLQSME